MTGAPSSSFSRSSSSSKELKNSSLSSSSTSKMQIFTPNPRTLTLRQNINRLGQKTSKSRRRCQRFGQKVNILAKITRIPNEMQKIWQQLWPCQQHRLLAPSAATACASVCRRKINIWRSGTCRYSTCTLRVPNEDSKLKERVRERKRSFSIQDINKNCTVAQSFVLSPLFLFLFHNILPSIYCIYFTFLLPIIIK